MHRLANKFLVVSGILIFSVASSSVESEVESELDSESSLACTSLFIASRISLTDFINCSVVTGMGPCSSSHFFRSLSAPRLLVIISVLLVQQLSDL